MPSSHTFLFTDIEGSTQRWERSPVEMRSDLARHDAILRQAIAAAGGSVFKTVGDAFYATFDSAERASEAALSIQRALASQTWATGTLKVRIAIHSGEAEAREGDYFGPTLNRVARILSAGHGGQVLLSEAARSGLDPSRQVLDLGARRLKDLPKPERIFQLVEPGLPQEFPPLRTLDVRPNRLPAQANEFIGRDAQLAEVRALLRRPSTRLLTLTGPGGTGKTRLALQLAGEQLDLFEDGVFWVALAGVREAIPVPTAIMAALGAPVGAPEEFFAWSAPKQLLVVLDNFEQVLEASRFLAQWLGAAPGLKLLVTSRARLKLSGEQDWPVPALQTAPLGGSTSVLAESDAVRLFVARARAARPDFKLNEQNARDVAELCARLDGLPLAIELAAARVRLLPPRAMLERIRASGAVLPLLAGGASDLPGRQQTLKRTIEWSDQLLSEPDRRALRAFSVFSGGADLDAASAVIGDDAFDRLEALLDSSLIQTHDGAGGPRFSILETVREFAHDGLAASGEEQATARRHAEYFLAFAEQHTAPGGQGSREADLTPLSREHDNLRAAVRWAQGQGDRELLRRLCGALWPFWELCGHWTEGREALSAALPSVGEPDDARNAGMLLAAGAIASTQGEFRTAEPLLQRALAVFRSGGDEPQIASTLKRMAFSAAYQGVYPKAAELIGEARTLLEKRGNSSELIEAMALQGWVVAELGDVERGIAIVHEALGLAQQLGEKLVMIQLHNAMGEMMRATDQLAAADEHYEQALVRARAIGNQRWAASVLGNLGDVRLRQSRLAEARALCLESIRLNIELGNRRNLPSMLVTVAALAQQLGELRLASRLFRVAQVDLLDSKVRLPLADQGVLQRAEALIHAATPASEREAGFAEAEKTSLAQALEQAMRLLGEAQS